MFLRDFLLFTLFFAILPLLNAAVLYKYCFQNTISASQSVLYTCVLSPALHSAVLILLYFFFPHQGNIFYLGGVLIANVLPILSLLYLDKHFFSIFLHTLVQEFRKEYILKLFVGIAVFGLLSLVILIRPINGDLLEYFEIGKVFYKEHALFYPVLPYYPDNFFSSHASHPPFFSALQTLAYLIQGSSDYYRVHSLIHAYYVLMLFLIMLTIMRKHFFTAFIFLILSAVTSSYASQTFILPSGLDAFRLTYFMLSFCMLQDLIQQPSNKTLLFFFAVSLGCSLSTHSSGLLFFILMLPIFLAVYTPSSHYEKYKNVLCVIFIALLVGGWQYVLNTYHFGKPISDDVLLWSKYDYKSYMRYERDLYSIYQMLNHFFEQFKFSSQGYGLFYPLFILLSLIHFREILSTMKQATFNLIGYKQKPLPIYTMHLLFVLGFFSTVLFSISINQDLIIKNFRYLMTTYLSLVILVFSFSIELSKKIWLNRTKIRYGQTALILVMLLLMGSLFQLSNKVSRQFITALGYQNLSLSYHDYLRLGKNKNLNALLSGNKEIIDYLDNHIKQNDVIFAFDRGQLYGNLPHVKINFYLDDSTIDFFDENTKQSLYMAMQKKNIKYIFSSHYKPFILSKSAFSDLLADPEYTTLVMNNGNYQLYRINDSLESGDYVSKKLATSNIKLYKHESETVEVELEPNQEYLLNIQHRHKDGSFYYVYAEKLVENQLDALAQITYDDSTKVRFSTKSQQQNAVEHAKLILQFSAKNKPIDLLVVVKKLDRRSRLIF